jgi:hypothetical protein
MNDAARNGSIREFLKAGCMDSQLAMEKTAHRPFNSDQLEADALLPARNNAYERRVSSLHQVRTSART